MTKKPLFFCDNCGYEVGSDVKACPFCGRFFASVRCPKCDYSGPDKMFQNGCPMCGYSAPLPPAAKSPPKKRVKKRKNAEPMPALTIIVSVLVLLFVLALLSYFITR